MTTDHAFKEVVETSDDKLITDCPACKSHLRVPKRNEQLRVKCPACHAMFVVDPPKSKPGDDTVAGWVLDDIDEAEEERMSLIPLPPLPPGELAAKGREKIGDRIAPSTHRDDTPKEAMPPQQKRESNKAKLLKLLARHKAGMESHGREQADPVAPATAMIVDRSGWDSDTYPQAVNLASLAPHLTVKECTPAGVRFRFDSLWLEHPGFRVSMPLRCFASGHHIPQELYARPMVFFDQSGGRVRSPQDATTGVGLCMGHRSPREVEAQLAKIDHMPSPFANPVPYYATMGCGDVYMECSTHKRTSDGGWTCEVLIPDLKTALAWLQNVNGVTGPEYRLLQRDIVDAHSESWAALALGARMRLAFWIGFKPGETFVRYFSDASALANDIGLAGLVLTSHRLIHRHRFTTSEVDTADGTVTLVIRVENDTPVLFLKRGGESSCIARLRVEDVNDFVDIIGSDTSFKLELADI